MGRFPSWKFPGNSTLRNGPVRGSWFTFTGRWKGGFVKGWFWRTYPRSGFRSGGTSAETTLFKFWKPPFCEFLIYMIFFSEFNMQDLRLLRVKFAKMGATRSHERATEKPRKRHKQYFPGLARWEPQRDHEKVKSKNVAKSKNIRSNENVFCLRSQMRFSEVWEGSSPPWPFKFCLRQNDASSSDSISCSCCFRKSLILTPHQRTPLTDKHSKIGASQQLWILRLPFVQMALQTEYVRINIASHTRYGHRRKLFRNYFSVADADTAVLGSLEWSHSR